MISILRWNLFRAEFNCRRQRQIKTRSRTKSGRSRIKSKIGWIKIFIMRLKTLELNGFKSFAHKTILEFHHPVVSIVGPNGSGKSNVVEAFRFVLGEQSMKSMRGRLAQI